MSDSQTTYATTDPHALVRVEALVPAWLLDKVYMAYPWATTSEIVQMGFSAMTGEAPPDTTRAEQPPVKVGRHERKDTP